MLPADLAWKDPNRPVKGDLNWPSLQKVNLSSPYSRDHSSHPGLPASRRKVAEAGCSWDQNHPGTAPRVEYSG